MLEFYAAMKKKVRKLLSKKRVSSVTYKSGLSKT